MDRRSWLWRRKSSEKSPAETESSGSGSSHSERFNDEQAYAIHNLQSPEVTSKNVTNDDDDNDNVKILMEKLSAALMNVSAKENSVKQHAKVADEAVTGWEKAEKEVVNLKQQLEAANKKSSGFEDRISHLDAALKECVRQLRQAREEQEQRINEVLAQKNNEWESTKSKLEAELVELQEQLHITKTLAASSAELDSDIREKLEALEKENAYLKKDLLSRAEELELRILERDLSTQAAEAASKQHLESIKKVAKLEAECRKLKSLGRKPCCANDHKSVTASLAYVESFTDSQSDIGERLLAIESDASKINNMEVMESKPISSILQTSVHTTGNAMSPSLEINLMDDFLEMERLAALPNTDSGGSYSEAGHALYQSTSSENHLKFELDAMVVRISALEEKLYKVEEEKEGAQMSLTECEMELEMSQSKLQEAYTKLAELRSQLALAYEANEEEIKSLKGENEVAALQLKIAESEIKGLVKKVDSLEALIAKESATETASKTKCQNLEEEISIMKQEAELQRAKRNNLQEELSKMKQEAEIQRAKCHNLEEELLEMKRETGRQQEVQLQRVTILSEELKIKQEREIAVAASKFAECQKTISSLGRQLRSLATLEDLFLDCEKSLEKTDAGAWRPAKGQTERILHT